jgi:ubiquinone/menaquinone biosynthesis C-methylase UbiE
MKVIEIGKRQYLVLESIKTRSGFKHLATLTDNFHEEQKASINYINRTWESFTFESVIKKVMEKAYVSKERQEEIIAICKKVL